jgi:hypothetical protein
MFCPVQSRDAVLEWCLPIVHDCLKEFYAEHFSPRSAAFKMLTDLHFRLWTSLVDGDFEAAREKGALLAKEAETLKASLDAHGAGNRYVAAEILDLSLRRFRRMPEEARQNNQALLAILTHLNRCAAPPAPVAQPLRQAA